MTSMSFGDVTSVLDAIPGVSTVATYVEQKAQAGAQAAIPDIQAQVQTVVLPYVVIALILGVGGLAIGLKAYKKANRATPAPLSGRRHRR